MAAASVPDLRLHLDGDDQGEVSRSEAPAGQAADTTSVAAQIFGLRDTGTWCMLPSVLHRGAAPQAAQPLASSVRSPSR